MSKVFTIGYGGRSPAEFVQMLADSGVKTIVDVRLRPDRAAMGAFAKAKSPDKGIERLLGDAGVGYRSFIELGNVFLDFDDWQDRYARLLAQASDLLMERLLEVPPPFCLMCAEKKVSECHRRHIADSLLKRGWKVTHLE